MQRPELPDYLQAHFNYKPTWKAIFPSLTFLKLEDIANNPSAGRKYWALLLRRHLLNDRIAKFGQCYPPTVLDRALTYEALGFDDLAAFDAYVVYELSLQVLNDEWVTDLEAKNYDLHRTPWKPNTTETRDYLIKATAVLVRALTALGATNDAAQKELELHEQLANVVPELSSDDKEQRLESLLKPVNLLHGHEASDGVNTKPSKSGVSRREIYPWNAYEPERNAPAAVNELNNELQKVAEHLEAKVTALPALDVSGGTWHQLGLFAKRDLAPGQEILREKSVLTAIRPIGDAICDACGQDLEAVPVTDREECPGVDCDLTFCSQDCATRAANEYHQPAFTVIESDDSDQDEEESTDNTDPPPPPFCSNPLAEDLTLIGRNTTTSTPEWDLYFLLLTRTIAMSITQSMHPLALPSTKHLWADFTPPPTYSEDPSAPLPPPPQRTLPFSLAHNIIKPLTFFATLASSLPASHPQKQLVTPYTKSWLENFDPWILQTLYAKFRGVANAQQSTFDGKPEIASVHPMWCLANHSCAPNVEWTPGGSRVFTVRCESVIIDGSTSPEDSKTSVERRAELRSAGKSKQGIGIKQGEEVFSHYTDVRLGVSERKERLQEVLGGQCQCERCVIESGSSKV